MACKQEAILDLRLVVFVVEIQRAALNVLLPEVLHVVFYSGEVETMSQSLVVDQSLSG